MQFHQTVHRSYRSPKSRGTATVVILCVYLALCFLSIIADFNELKVYSGRDEDVQAVQVFSGVVALIGLIVYIATAIVFCMWLYRIYQNLHAMGVKNLRMSPG